MNLRILFVVSFVMLLSLSIQAKPLKVFILAGQSNMQGHAQATTLEAIKQDPAMAEMAKKLFDANGEPVVCQDVWISNLQNDQGKPTQGQLTIGYGAPNGVKVGPELTFGIYINEMLNEPVLIIKTAWGGKSLHTDFRPPSAGPSTYSEAKIEQFKSQNKDIEKLKAERQAASGHYYRLMMEHINKVLGDIQAVYPDYDAKDGYEIAGFVWFQGWNDMVDSGEYPQRSKPGGYDAYSENLAKFIRDVRKDLKTPNMPFVIGVMGTGGELDPDSRYTPTHQNFRDAMAAPALMQEFKGNVAAVWTHKAWDEKLEELDAREGQVRGKMREFQKQLKDGQITREQMQQKQDELYTQAFTPEELAYLRLNKSNAGFHYLGSGKVMTGIGKLFAQAMFDLMQQPSP